MDSMKWLDRVAEKKSTLMDIYSSSVEKMVAAVDLLDAAMKTREKLLDQDLSGSIA